VKAADGSTQKKTPAKKAPKPTLPASSAPAPAAAAAAAAKEAKPKVTPKVEKAKTADGPVPQYLRVPGTQYKFVTVKNDKGFLEAKYAPVAAST
jgi:hypothetical protein